MRLLYLNKLLVKVRIITTSSFLSSGRQADPFNDLHVERGSYYIVLALAIYPQAPCENCTAYNGGLLLFVCGVVCQPSL
jgi:hypothetical protein